MENIHCLNVKIVDVVWYTKKIFALKILSPNISNIAEPGQFVMIRGENWNTQPFLSRPMSISRINKEKNIVEIQILVTGKGTEELSKLQHGNNLSIVGPLGNRFTLPENGKNVALIAGGIGIAPLLYLDKILLEQNIETSFFYGATTKEDLIPFDYIPDRINLSTDDGSIGFNGYVTDHFFEYQKNKKIDLVYACGPTPMLIALQKLLKKVNIPCQLSIETRMACGYGICQGCVVKQNKDEQKYLLTCKDGPVFDSDSIFLGE